MRSRPRAPDRVSRPSLLARSDTRHQGADHVGRGLVRRTRFSKEMLEAELFHARVKCGGPDAEQLRGAACTVDSAVAVPQRGNDVVALATLHLFVRDTSTPSDEAASKLASPHV